MQPEADRPNSNLKVLWIILSVVGHSLSFTLILVEEDGAWKINDMTVP